MYKKQSIKYQPQDSQSGSDHNMSMQRLIKPVGGDILHNTMLLHFLIG